MSDILGIAGNAVAAYQNALGTISNNIANVATVGYSRQQVTLEANPIAHEGNVYLGTGVNVAGVQRQYDAFTSANLRNSNSDLSSQDPVVTYSNRLIDVMGGDSTGLTTALNQFFNSAQSLSANPASTVQRSTFLTDAQGLTSRFNELSSQLNLVQSDTDQAIQSNVSSMNTIFGELANVNKQLTGKLTEAAQPPDLLDKRDKLLLDLSGYAHVNASFTPNGTVTVSLGPTINQDVVVSGSTSKLISTSPSGDGSGKTALILDQYGSPSTLNSITSGSLSGLLTFQDQVLTTSKSALDNLATTLTTAINNVHEQGIDGYGQPGGPLFTIDPKASSIAGSMQVAFTDPMKVSASAEFRVTPSNTNSSNTSASLTYVNPATAAVAAGPSPLQSVLTNNNNPSAGRAVTIDSSRPAMAIGTIQNGLQDVSVFLDNPQPGQELQVMTRDGRQILGSAIDPTSSLGTALMSTPGVATGAQFSANYLNKSGSAGYKDMTVFYGARAGVLQKPVYDSSGHAVSTQAIAANLTSTPINPLSPGFAAGSFVLNGVSLGALTPTGGSLSAPQVADWLNTANAPGAQPQPSGVTATASNEILIPDDHLNLGASLSINGKNIGLGPFANKEALIQAINNTPGVGVTAGTKADGTFVLSNADGSNIDIESYAGGSNVTGNALGLSPGLHGGTISMTRPLAAAPVTTTQANQINVPASQLNLSLPLAINGQTIPSTVTGGGFNSAQDLANSINKAQSVVVASVGIDGSLTLSSLNGPNNNSIQIASDSAGNNLTGNALGLPAQVFQSAITSITSQQSSSVQDTPIELGFGSGTPSDLAQLGMRTGAYIEGAAKDDLMVFVTGAGTASVSASYSGQPVDTTTSLRSQPLELSFVDATHYRIRDVNTDTVVAERTFDPTQLNPGVNYQGLQISFNTPPQAGDVFTVDGNSDGTGNNQNILALANVENTALIGNKTISTAYTDQVNNIGNVAQQATIAQSALKVVHDQAVSAVDKVSGVSLDQEAADLIRFQQAYQAAAKVLQVGSQLFDTILQSH